MASIPLVVHSGSRSRRIARAEWGLIAGIGLIDLALGLITGLPVTAPSSFLLGLGLLSAIWPLTALLARFAPLLKGGVAVAENILKYLSISLAGSVLEYYIAASPLPLADRQLIALDRWLGFDWPVFFDWVGHHPAIETALRWCYASLHLQVMLLIGVIGALDPERGRRFITACLIAVLLTLLVFGLVPAAGPFVAFGHTDLPPALYTEHYLQLRQHGLRAIPLDDLRGIVSFPSLHVAGAVILTAFCRGTPLLFALAIVLNIGMAIGAIVIGGHYLVDLLGGVAVGLTALAAMHGLYRGEPTARLTVLPDN